MTTLRNKDEADATAFGCCQEVLRPERRRALVGVGGPLSTLLRVRWPPDPPRKLLHLPGETMPVLTALLAAERTAPAEVSYHPPVHRMTKISCEQTGGS